MKTNQVNSRTVLLEGLAKHAGRQRPPELAAAAEKAKAEICQMMGIKESQIVAWDMFSPSLKIQILTFADLPETLIKFSWSNLSDAQRSSIKASALAFKNIYGQLFKELAA